ncbi:Hpt domain-containing protein [Marichromatium bheemlicum]|uniref:Hpt domain-containing protein n=1 Tax=Marichromatium bheemlicum TaxID=365339 RepID=UPI001B2FFA4A|nr:Hpt domain-containing protein [Marichromatium bheemlicum]
MQPPRSELPIHDAAAALASVGGDRPLAAELFTVLLAELPAELEALRTCCAEADWPGLADYVHQMRIVIRHCGVPALDAELSALERAARIGDAQRATATLAEVAAQIQRLGVIIAPSAK